MKRVRIFNTHFESGMPKYLKGQCYPLSDDTALMVAKGLAEEVDVEVESAALQQPEAQPPADQQDPADSADDEATPQRQAGKRRRRNQ